MQMSTATPPTDDTVIGRFDRLFALCEQEMRSAQPRRRITRKDTAKEREDVEAFRQAAIQSLLNRPIG